MNCKEYCTHINSIEPTTCAGVSIYTVTINLIIDDYTIQNYMYNIDMLLGAITKTTKFSVRKWSFTQGSLISSRIYHNEFSIWSNQFKIEYTYNIE